MADLLKSGAAWLSGVLQSHASQAVTYSRGPDSVELTATIGNTDFQTTDADGFFSQVQSRDFIFPAADLVLGGETVLPERGDEITEVVGDTTYTYAVLPFGDEGEHYKFSDPHRTILRVHTKKRNTEEA